LEYNVLDVNLDFQFTTPFVFTNILIVNTWLISFGNLIPTFILLSYSASIHSWESCARVAISCVYPACLEI